MLIGDSHASHWFPGLEGAAIARGVELREATKASCPIADVRVFVSGVPQHTEQCDRFRDRLFALIVAEKPDVVVTSNWQQYSDDEIVSDDEARTTWKRQLRKSLRALVDSGIKVILIRDTPRMGFDYLDCLASSAKHVCDVPRAAAFNEDEALILREFGDRVTLVDFTDRFCDLERCYPVDGSTIRYRDSHHLSASFAATFAGDFAKVFADAGL